MKGVDGTVIPVEPDTQQALERVLQSGGSAKVMLEGSDTVFIMTKAEKGGDYELSQIAAESSSETMRKALEKIKSWL